MSVLATIELNPTKVRDIICDYLSRQGIQGVSHQDISFEIKGVEKGTQMDYWTEYELTSIKIKNIRIGKEGI